MRWCALLAVVAMLAVPAAQESPTLSAMQDEMARSMKVEVS